MKLIQGKKIDDIFDGVIFLLFMIEKFQDEENKKFIKKLPGEEQPFINKTYKNKKQLPLVVAN